ncbi:MAG: C4-dicarboxylate ABC transporter permease [Alphaproteobacteria bacterium]|jgi:TRAP-type C4-dicarboxylate transport system substrate-binding protein|nr:C4-dicarboxylate ABC transporter permease [Alphaproteobacteria bacterium]
MTKSLPITAGAAALLAGSFAAPAAAETIPVNVVNGHPPIFLWVKHLTETFIPTVDAALEGTDHEIAWTEHYGGSLAPVGGELEALEAGLAEVGVVPTVFEPSNLPLQNVTYVTPFGTPDPVLITDVIDRLHDEIPGMAASWETYDLEYLGGGFALDNYYLLTTFPVDSLADLEGRKIGAPGPAVNWLEGTGAVGVSGNLTTYYNDIQTGVFEGVIVFPTAAAPAKLFEVAPYVTRTDFGAQYAGSVVANALWLDGQPQAVQDALRAGAEAYTAAFTQELVARVESSLAAMEEGGATIATLPAAEREAWAAALPNVAQDWAAQADAQGLPGTAVLEAYMQALRDAGADLARNWDEE